MNRGNFFLMTGFRNHWLAILIIAMFPILPIIYRRLGSDERHKVEAKIGETAGRALRFVKGPEIITKGKTMIIFNAILLALAPASALAAQSSDTQIYNKTGATEANPQYSTRSTPENVLTAYRDAIQKLDVSKMKPLFSEESQIFENGKAEGTFLHYLERHLGPELGHVKSFTFTQPTISLTQVDNTAFATETYGYVIVLHDDRKIERTGIATSVLVREGDNWKILRYHSSSRAPKKAQ